MFSFAYPKLLLLLLLIPAYLLLYMWARYARRRNLKKFGRLRVIAPLMPQVSPYKPVIKIIVQLTALAMLVIAFARPWGGVKDEKTTKEGIEVVIAVDASNSMLASSTAGVEVFTHIRYMLYTTVPSMLIALGVFTVAGLALDHGVSTHAEMYAATLAVTFRITPWLLAVPLATGMLIARKLPAIVTLFSSVVFACAAMLLAQPELVARVAGVGELDFMSGFKGVLMTCFGPTAIPTGAPQLDELVATRGMAGMLNTVWLIICAMCFGGVMTGSGMLRSLTSIFLRWVRRAFSAVASTVGAGLFFNLCTADQYISIILSGRLFRDLYADRGLEPRLLSRSVEDSATVCSVLIPWNSCGMTQATVLGVSTFVYAPYCIFNIVSPLMSLLVAAVGWNIKRKK